MKKLLLFLIVFFFLIKGSAIAVYSPLSQPNNKFGIHILSADEMIQAADLVNSSGGDWGYITMPIQVSDKDLTKWQSFMDEAKKLHLIPILRLATNGDYFNTAVWQKPNFSDVLDFANFLNALEWPTKNKYIIVFNEVNRGDEWGGTPDPENYAQILSYAVTAFKSKDPDFFIISAGLDNAAENSPGFMNEYTFMERMNYYVPGIFNQIDGLSSHSYPNPGFIQHPSIQTQKSTSSFKFEQSLANSLSGKTLPVFITETGWTSEKISDQQIADYFVQSFLSTWSDDSIVAVTPFLLKAGAGPFSQFSFLLPSGEINQRYKSVKSMNKLRGQPILSLKKVLGEAVNVSRPVKTFDDEEENGNNQIKVNTAKEVLKWFFKVR